MYKLKIQRVGPIENGYGSQWLEISPLTVFVGDQGSGKSTIAKILSTCIWIEKSLVRRDWKAEYITKYNRFEKELDFQGIKAYLKEDSLIEYQGPAYHLIYSSRNLVVRSRDSNGTYKFPKLMYIPAERNFVAVVGLPHRVKRLPKALYTFMEEYLDSISSLSEKFELPIGNSHVRRKGQTLILEGPGYSIGLFQASSGYQALVPMLMVIQHLQNIVVMGTPNDEMTLSVDEKKKLDRKITSLLNDTKISDEVKSIALRHLSGSTVYEMLVNIIEEPELSLYPDSQGEMLYSVLASHNAIPNNHTVITTHSPYIINYLTLAAKAYEIYHTDNSATLSVPRFSAINGEAIVIYKMKEGKVTKVQNYRSLPSDENPLNQELEKFNTQFIEMLIHQKNA